MTIDKYTKLILTLIAVGIIGINFYLYDVKFVKKAHAVSINVAVMQIEKIIEKNTNKILKEMKATCK